MKGQDATGWICVRTTTEFEDSDDEDDTHNGQYTQQEVNHIRCLIIPPAREKSVEDMTKLLLGKSYGNRNGKQVFNPEWFSSSVLSAFDVMVTSFKQKRSWPKKFNILFGFTLAIYRYDCWLDAKAEKMEKMVNELSAMWKKVLIRSAELEIDDEFTRPGLVCFLFKFFDKVSTRHTISFASTYLVHISLSPPHLVTADQSF